MNYVYIRETVPPVYFACFPIFYGTNSVMIGLIIKCVVFSYLLTDVDDEQLIRAVCWLVAYSHLALY